MNDTTLIILDIFSKLGSLNDFLQSVSNEIYCLIEIEIEISRYFVS